jgi:enoyl-CoA hydratase/carnithine racemase
MNSASDPTIYPLSKLLADAPSPYAFAENSALDADPWLIVDLRETVPAPLERFDGLDPWLRNRPCPTVAVGAASHPLAAAFDVLLPDTADVARIAANIAQAPLTALVLVQVLRRTEGLAMEAALTIESLGYATLQTGPEFRRWLATRAPLDIPPDTEPPLLLEREDHALRLRLNRPAQRNAITAPLRDALCEALQLVVTDQSIERVEIRGNGACFSIGGALEEFGSIGDGSVAHAIRSVRLPANLLAQCGGRAEFHVHSACIGAGAEIPAFGARVTASRNVFFQLPELQFGLIPGAGGCVSIPRRIGRQRTAYMALSMKKINATTALEWGLIDAIVQDDRSG